MNEKSKLILMNLADTYETKEFYKNDPSQFLCWYNKSQIIDIECAAFLSAMLAFGRREQFIPKIKDILTLADKKSGSVSKWIHEKCPGFKLGDNKYYRFYSYNDLYDFFQRIEEILCNYGSLGECVKKILVNGDSPNIPYPSLLPQIIISTLFKDQIIVPGGHGGQTSLYSSPKKRIHLFLRWMVRQNSPVDLGIWDFISPADLIIPLDTHVLQESVKLGLLPYGAKGTMGTALELTEQAKQIWRSDPVKCDYALFGLGVDENRSLLYK
ncbi:MAG: TIGR02757 family protein [Treponema sp.]|nr:TIGR02757 family protein [Treponema sp.]